MKNKLLLSFIFIVVLLSIIILYLYINSKNDSLSHTEYDETPELNYGGGVDIP